MKSACVGVLSISELKIARWNIENQWTTTNFSQVQLYTPWWWIEYDPKHVEVILNFMSFTIFINVNFNF